MICFETAISKRVFGFLKKNREHLSDFVLMNTIIREVSGINNFFATQDQASELLVKIENHTRTVAEPDRRAYGDFQTNIQLAEKIVDHVISEAEDYEFVLEPTCGKGNFLLAAIMQLKNLKRVVGVEIYLPYVWETKFKILEYFLGVEERTKPEIEIIHANAFAFSYKGLAESTRGLKALIIGNPPWVTNSELGSIDSSNLPVKSNFKKHKGLEALTGKGNFDIGEYVSLTMLRCFNNHNGTFAFLIKNSVIKNLIYDQINNKFRIGQTKNLNIDSKKEFNASVKAGLFLSNFNQEPEFTCTTFDFYTEALLTTFGWYKDKFVSSVLDYDDSCIVDGKSAFVWRSGVKHDCSKVMELEKVNGLYINALGEEMELENDLMYGLLKSSDLKDHKTNSFRKITIITQRKIGQSTTYIKSEYPLVHKYLSSHKAYFDRRKSAIYKDKPDFSIFGIGEYSFATYKVAISGLYKSTHFTLVGPFESKPIMLDDTCYFIGFDDLTTAKIAHFLLNSNLIQKFLKSIIFTDSKRAINKDILMRIDFEKAFESAVFDDAQKVLENLSKADWDAFGEKVKQKVSGQLALF